MALFCVLTAFCLNILCREPCKPTVRRAQPKCVFQIRRIKFGKKEFAVSDRRSWLNRSENRTDTRRPRLLQALCRVCNRGIYFAADKTEQAIRKNDGQIPRRPAEAKSDTVVTVRRRKTKIWGVLKSNNQNNRKSKPGNAIDGKAVLVNRLSGRTY